MERYDVAIIGNSLCGLITAAYLSKRLRNVAVFSSDTNEITNRLEKRFRDSERSMFRFSFYHHEVAGNSKNTLFWHYLNQCGLDQKLSFMPHYQTMVERNGEWIRRPNDFHNFHNYLIRHYPKQKDGIDRLFHDLEEHYNDYLAQKMARLKNKEYTLTSSMIEYVDLSLKQVLSKYFKDVDLMNEFTYFNDAAGLDLENINAYYYFIKWFDQFMNGSYVIRTSYNEMKNQLITEVSKNREKVMSERKITSIHLKNGEIDYVVDQDGNKVTAKHYIFNMTPKAFLQKFAPNNEELWNLFYILYPNAKSPVYRNVLYLGLNIDLEELNIKEKEYIFPYKKEDNVRLISLINYKKYDKKSCPNGKTALLIEFVNQDLSKEKMIEAVTKQFLKYFPTAKGHITLQRLGDKEEFYGGLASKIYWKEKELADLFTYDDYSFNKPFPNAYLVSELLKPEAGLTGMFQTGIELGDIIDEKIYHGDEEDYFITHDELINIISHQFIPNALGKEEKNIQFFIGKDSYYIRTKGNIHRVYKGVSDMADLIIIATNEALYDLSVGNTTLEKVLRDGSLDFVGDRDFLNEVIEAFDMGIEITKPETYNFVHGKWGFKVLLYHMSIILVSNLLSNYHLNIYLAPLTALFFGVGSYWKYKLTKRVTLFEYVVIVLYISIGILSIFIPEINELKDAKYTLGFFTVYLFITWLINHPIAFYYIRHDYRIDYTRTKLFLKMSGGLTFIWAVTFLTILSLDFRLIQSYASLGYYLVPLSIYLSLYYPSSYISGYID